LACYIAPMRTFEHLAELVALVGEDIAVSDWIAVTQQQIDLFAEATGDHQWIHVDPERAKDGPFGTTIAHGFFTLSLIPKFFDSAITVRDTRMGVNYGLNRVRFTAPVPVDSRVRASLKLIASEAIAGNGWQMTWSVTVEREGGDRPVCVAESISRRYV
jgi:acyl dehydratase